MSKEKKLIEQTIGSAKGDYTNWSIDWEKKLEGIPRERRSSFKKVRYIKLSEEVSND